METQHYLAGGRGSKAIPRCGIAVIFGITRHNKALMVDDLQRSDLILVVDDDAVQRLVLQQALEQDGHQVIEASNGETALDLFTRMQPDMVLLDAVLPNMDGFTTCARIRAQPHGTDLPILIITGLDDQSSVDWAFAAGASDYVTKPLHWAVLRQRVRRLLWNQCRQRSLRASEATLAAAQHVARIGNWSYDLAGKQLRWSSELFQIVGAEPRSFQPSFEAYLHYVYPEDQAFVRQAFAEAITDFRPRQHEHRISCGDGEQRVVQFRSAMVYDDIGAAREVVGTLQDITERVALEEQLRRQAFYEPLTGLPNRALFMDRLQHALARTERSRSAVAVLFVDLDGFKLINDSLGHDVGDQLLRAVADRMMGCLRPEDTAAHLGADQFTVLLEDVGDVTVAMRVADRILSVLQLPFTLDDRTYSLTASVGIVCPVGASERPVEVLRNAHLALSRAKSTGRAQTTVFDHSMTAEARERLELQSDLRGAVERGEMRVVYQPIVALETGAFVSVEALVRWAHPKRGLLTPAHFVPLAEETGLIVDIGRWVLEEACRQVRLWQAQAVGAQALQLSVNLCARQFQDPNLVEMVVNALRLTGLEPATLALELTETAAMDQTPATITAMQEFSRLGIQLAIDDFGTGYSSLAYIRRFPLNILKLDRAFVAGLGRNSDDTAIVRAIITMAHALHLSVTAEGVEMLDQRTLLQAMGCNHGQGYLFGKPMPPSELEETFKLGEQRRETAPLIERTRHA